MEAFDLLRHARALDPTDPAIAFMLGGNYAQQGVSDRALSLLEEAYGADSTNLTYARALSAGYIEAGRMQDALHINERLSAADPEDDDVRYRLIQLYARTGELKKGDSARYRATEAFPAYARGLWAADEDEDPAPRPLQGLGSGGS